MFQTKQKKIKAYLNSLTSKSAFDELLTDYIDGTMKQRLCDMGITKFEFCIDWHEDIKCIGIQARYKKYYIDIQIYEEEFAFSANEDEADESVFTKLESSAQFYFDINNSISALKC